MKKYIINYCMNKVKSLNKYDEVKLKEIKYGLETIYLTLSKFIIIFLIALVLNIEKEMIIYTLIYNIIRMPSFGLHATKSWICLISSTLLFIGIPFLAANIKIDMIYKIIICSLGIIFMLKNSPADTYKRPIVNKKRRKVYKILSTLVAIIYTTVCITIKNNFISNCFLMALVMQNFMIAPLTYKIFKLPYNNYIAYIKKHPELHTLS